MPPAPGPPPVPNAPPKALNICSNGVPLNGLLLSSSGPCPGSLVMAPNYSPSGHHRSGYASTTLVRVNAAPSVVRLLDIRDTPLEVSEVLDALAGPAVGGLDVFVGTVRDHDGGQGVTGLEYSAHPTAMTRL